MDIFQIKLVVQYAYPLKAGEVYTCFQPSAPQWPVMIVLLNQTFTLLKVASHCWAPARLIAMEEISSC